MGNSEIEVIRGLRSIDKQLDRIADALEYMVREDKKLKKNVVCYTTSYETEIEIGTEEETENGEHN